MSLSLTRTPLELDRDARRRIQTAAANKGHLRTPFSSCSGPMASASCLLLQYTRSMDTLSPGSPRVYSLVTIRRSCTLQNLPDFAFSSSASSLPANHHIDALHAVPLALGTSLNRDSRHGRTYRNTEIVLEKPGSVAFSFLPFTPSDFVFCDVPFQATRRREGGRSDDQLPKPNQTLLVSLLLRRGRDERRDD